MKKYVFIILIISAGLLAQIPDGYYDGTDNLYGEALKSVLNNIIDNHYELSYDDLRDFVLKNTDEDPNNSSNIILFYTGRSQSKTTFGGGADQWNREHVWAKSHGDFGDSPPCGTDAHHVRPTDASVNSTRGNKDFDNGGNAIYDNGYLAGWTDADSWEPRDDVKGDVARIIFYMATRYEGEGGELDLEAVDTVNTDPNPEHGKLSTLLEWNQLDPPDEFEQNRNDVIYGYQNNRNPFIDHPEFVNYIWGPPVLVANFSADITIGNSPLEVQFSDTSNGENISAWSWDFDNDGSIDSNLQNPSFIYQEIGNYDVTLTVEDNQGNSDTETKYNFIEVTSATLPVEILAESFENSIPDWDLINIASNKNWEQSDDTSTYTHPETIPDGNWYMYANNYGGDEPANDWLISPAFNLSIYDNPYCNFQSWTKYSDSIVGLELKITTNYTGNPNTTSWNNLSANLPDANSSIWEGSGEINLSTYTNEQNICIAFHYQSTGDGANQTRAWAIDNLKIIGTPQTILYGDVDGNGEIQAMDASLVLQNVVEFIEFEDWQIIAGDVDGNGEIQAFDTSLILQHTVGLISEFPVE